MGTFDSASQPDSQKSWHMPDQYAVPSNDKPLPTWQPDTELLSPMQDAIEEPPLKDAAIAAESNLARTDTPEDKAYSQANEISFQPQSEGYIAASAGEPESPALKHVASWSASGGGYNQGGTSSISEPVCAAGNDEIHMWPTYSPSAPEEQEQQQEQYEQLEQEPQQPQRKVLVRQRSGSEDMLEDQEPAAVRQAGEGHAANPGRSIWVRKYFKYHMQRLQTTANHVLFYVVDEQEQAHLAIVGTDVRLSGHFVYCSLPGFKDGPPVRCTNRVKVMEWLASIGATDSADPDHVKVPAISRQQLDMLLTSDPMFSKPKMDKDYTSWREEGGRLSDGRHYKTFYLVEAHTQQEKLVITAEDSHRRDRRYAYKAVPDMGGFAFENGQAVKEWLDFVVGRTPGGPLPRPLSRTRNPSSGAAGRKANAPKLASWKSAPQVRPIADDADIAGPGTLRAVGAHAPVSVPLPAGSLDPRIRLGRGPATSGSYKSQPVLALDADSRRTGAGAGAARQGSQGSGGPGAVVFNWNSPPAQQQSGFRLVQLADAPAGSEKMGQAPGNVKPPQPLSSNGMHTNKPQTLHAGTGLPGCAPGMPCHSNTVAPNQFRYSAMPNAPIQATPYTSAPTNQQQYQQQPIGNTQQKAYSQQQPQQTGSQPTIVHLEPLRPAGQQQPNPLQLGQQRPNPLQLDQPQTPSRPLAGAGHQQQTVLRVGRTGPDVVAAFSDDNDLSDWVMSVPGPADVARFEMWCARLTGAVSASAGDQRAVEEALAVLGQLRRERVNLRLLETTKVGASVAALHRHADPRVSQAAAALATKWRNIASAALNRASAALQDTGDAMQQPSGSPTQLANGTMQVQHSNGSVQQTSGVMQVQHGNGVMHLNDSPMHQANGSMPMQHADGPMQQPIGYMQHGGNPMQMQQNGNTTLYTNTARQLQQSGAPMQPSMNGMQMQPMMQQNGNIMQMQHAAPTHMQQGGNPMQPTNGMMQMQQGGSMQMQHSDNQMYMQQGAGPMQHAPANSMYMQHGGGPMQQVGMQPHGNGVVYMQQNGHMPMQQNGNMPMQHNSNMAMQQTGNMPMQHNCNMPMQQNGNMPLQQNGNMPMQQNGNMPMQQNGNMPMQQQNGNMPMQQYNNTPHTQGSGGVVYMQQHNNNNGPMQQQNNGNVTMQHGSGNMQLQAQHGLSPVPMQHSMGAMPMQPDMDVGQRQQYVVPAANPMWQGGMSTNSAGTSTGDMSVQAVSKPDACVEGAAVNQQQMWAGSAPSHSWAS